MIHYILTDIEGTTTDIAFVHKVLFPYSTKYIDSFIRENKDEKEVQKYLELTQNTILSETNETDTSIDNCIKWLEYWIKTDRKHPALKGIQGLLWKKGYEKGEFKGHIYPDVLPELIKWQQQGFGIGIYSSGSVAAQKLLFGFSDYGDINHFFDHNFDTTVGHKQEVASYENITKQLNLLPSEVLFLSDVEKELEAAHTAGMEVVQVVRDGTIASTKYATARDFTVIKSLF